MPLKTKQKYIDSLRDEDVETESGRCGLAG